jgi:hypothetical protein
LKVKYLNPLSLESENDINQAISNYGANLFMIINQTESSAYAPGSGSGGRFDVNIFQKNSESPV